MADWPSVQLKDCVELLAGFAFKSERFTDAESDIPLVKGENIGQGEILWAISKHWPADDSSIPAKYRLNAGDIVVAMDRPWVPAGLKWAFIRATDPSSYLVQRVARLRADARKLDQEFLRFVIGGPGFESYIRPITTGVNVPHISGAQILAHAFALPPLPIQRRIASILSAYDDLIENNRKRIAILEDMARRLYRAWFAHFRYPGHESVPLVDSPLGQIPQGWSCACICEVVKRHPPGRIFQKDETHSSGAIPVYDQSTDEVVGYHEGEPGLPASPECPVGMFGDHTCKLQLLVAPCSIGPNVVTFVAERDLPMAFLHHALIGLISTQEYKRHWTQLGAKRIVIPTTPLARRFSDFVLPNIQLQETLRLLTRNLRRTRDLLLPRLMSGTLSVEALATAEAAAP